MTISCLIMLNYIEPPFAAEKKSFECGPETNDNATVRARQACALYHGPLLAGNLRILQLAAFCLWSTLRLAAIAPMTILLFLCVSAIASSYPVVECPLCDSYQISTR
jgi:hypothetical protein